MDMEAQDIRSAELKKRRSDLTSALDDAELLQTSVLQRIQESRGKETAFLDNAATYIQIDRVICKMKKNLDDVKLELSKLDDLEAYNTMTWFQGSQAGTKDLCNLVSSTSGIGAAFTYSTIFSATRGSIVFMSWAFLGFLLGFLGPIFAQFMLSWAGTVGSRVHYPREYIRKFAKFGVPCCIVLGFVSAAAATCLILLSMYGIQYAPIPSGFSEGTTTFTDSIRVVFWIAIGFSAFTVLILLGLISVLIGSNIFDLGALKEAFLFGVTPKAPNSEIEKIG